MPAARSSTWVWFGVVLCWAAGAAAQEPGVRLLDSRNQPIDAERGALSISQLVTNGDTWPERGYEAMSPGGSDVRIEIADVPGDERKLPVVIESVDAADGVVRNMLALEAERPGPGKPFRTDFVRFVGDETDLEARGVRGRALRVELRDKVVVREADQTRSYRVARPGSEGSPNAARQARLTVHVLRREAGQPAVIGKDDHEALQLLRQQVRTANEIWLQCQLTFGDPAQIAMDIVDPPGPTLLSIGDRDGLPAKGGGEIVFSVDGKVVGPILTRPGATPIETAREVARAVQAQGFSAELSENLKTRYGAGTSADILVRHRDSSFVTLAAKQGTPLSSDARQKLSIGSVDLGDGLREFDNATAQVGTLEERTLIKALADDDPQTIDLFVVNRFEFATRQGEAFIAAGQGPIANAVVIDRNGLRQAPLAWTLAHELGHVLLDDPMHPDNVGPDRPWLLMDADNGRGTVNGPKRLRPEECTRVRQVSTAARAPLLLPYDVGPQPSAAELNRTAPRARSASR
ncbi:MAG TPA: hypothetical protein VJV78_19510 [Polyangiales bacterium]|nr:hypothetical protein [Polyangiales bacterium]